MVLATCDDGRPSARTVLLKSVSTAGFVFFTNYQSRKATEIAANPAVALLFGWYALQRQVRVEGEAETVSRAESEDYFRTRPRGSQLGAWASAQSSVVASREELAEAYAAAEQRFAGQDVPCPPYWGGYLVSADHGRVLAGPTEPDARPAALHPSRGRLDAQPPGPLTDSQQVGDLSRRDGRRREREPASIAGAARCRYRRTWCR